MTNNSIVMNEDNLRMRGPPYPEYYCRGYVRRALCAIRVEEVVFPAQDLWPGKGLFVCDCSDVCPEESLRLNGSSQTSDMKTVIPEGLLEMWH